ncbi:hypothetical protein P8452_66624 [Trifolium repens]|nr:hypothetical protein P8452_66624 [Trifolium repens]
MVHMKKGKVEVQFDDVVDILPGKEDVRIWVRVVHLWKVSVYFQQGNSNFVVNRNIKILIWSNPKTNPSNAWEWEGRFRQVSKVKDFIVEILKNNNNNYYPSSHKKRNNIKKKIILGSFRLHYNWCSSKSSHVLPVPEPVYEGYLQWLEEEKKKKKKKIEEGDEKEKEIVNENIDMLAEMFIANCHEKFKLEKQESDRRFQEMIARSM